MKVSFLKTIAILILLAFSYLLFNALWTGIHSQPSEGDSIVMHIPAAKEILRGTVFNPEAVGLTYYPLSGEAILSFFVFFNIPLNLYNVTAIFLLFLTTFHLGKRFSFSKEYALIFAATLCTLYGVLRYVNTQQIDIWLLIFFIVGLILLEKPQKKTSYLFALGATLGMIAGTKYSGPFFVFILLLVYGKPLLKMLNLNRILAFSVPFILLGLSWYIRNLMLTGDPFYPQDFLFFKGNPAMQWYVWQYWQVLFFYPMFMFNALISEFMIWMVSFIIVPIVLLYERYKKKKITLPSKLLVLTTLTTLIFLFLPPPPLKSYTSVVFGIRYGFPVIMLFLLLVFLLAKKYKKESLVASIAIANISYLFLPLPYQPKVLFLYIPLVSAVLLFAGKLFKKYSVVQ